MVDGGGLVSLLQGGIDVAVAHDVAGTAGRHLVDVHVQTSLFVPGEKSVVVVHLAALGLVVVAHVAAAPAWLSGKYFTDLARNENICDGWWPLTGISPFAVSECNRPH